MSAAACPVHLHTRDNVVLATKVFVVLHSIRVAELELKYKAPPRACSPEAEEFEMVHLIR